MLELIGHEIECHLRGSENCRALIESIIGTDSPLAPLIPIIAKSDNELFYEGVAKNSDVDINGSAALPLPYATIACNQARRSGERASFRDIAEVIYCYRLRNGATDKAAKNGAWATTYRIMRGCTNTSIGGYCFPKDYVYLGGYRIAQDVEYAYCDFASMTISEIAEIAKHHELTPKFPHLNAVKTIKAELLK